MQKHSRAGYNIAALLFFFLFLDNLLRHVEGQGWKRFWPCSGRLEVVVMYGMFSLVAQFVYWSRIVSGFNQEQHGSTRRAMQVDKWLIDNQKMVPTSKSNGAAVRRNWDGSRMEMHDLPL